MGSLGGNKPVQDSSKESAARLGGDSPLAMPRIRNLNELPIPGNVIRMPDVPLPKMKSILNVIARPPARSSPRRTPKSETYKSFDPETETVESTPLMDDRQLHSPDCPSEDRYEEISTSRTEEMEDLPPPPPPIEEEMDEEEEDLPPPPPPIEEE